MEKPQVQPLQIDPQTHVKENQFHRRIDYVVKSMLRGAWGQTFYNCFEHNDSAELVAAVILRARRSPKIQTAVLSSFSVTDWDIHPWKEVAAPFEDLSLRKITLAAEKARNLPESDRQGRDIITPNPRFRITGFRTRVAFIEESILCGIWGEKCNNYFAYHDSAQLIAGVTLRAKEIPELQTAILSLFGVTNWAMHPWKEIAAPFEGLSLKKIALAAEQARTLGLKEFNILYNNPAHLMSI